MASAYCASGDAALLLLLVQLIHARLVLAAVLVLATVLVLAVLALAGLTLAMVFVVGGAFLLLLAGTLAARARLLGCCSGLPFGALAVVRACLGALRRGLGVRQQILWPVLFHFPGHSGYTILAAACDCTILAAACNHTILVFHGAHVRSLLGETLAGLHVFGQWLPSGVHLIHALATSIIGIIMPTDNMIHVGWIITP